MAEVTFENVSKIYPDGTRAVSSIDLGIKDGEFMVLVGPSGCGKTTALRMVAGLEEISEGELKIGDRVVNNVAPRNRDIAMVFQSYALYPHLTVYDNIAFGLRLRKMPKSEIDERVKDAARVLDTYWSCGDVGELGEQMSAGGLEVTDVQTHLGTARFGSAGELVATEIEGSPLAGRIEGEVYERIKARTAEALEPYVTSAGSLDAPLRGHVVTAVPTGR
jgi:hypothetical protein